MAGLWTSRQRAAIVAAACALRDPKNHLGGNVQLQGINFDAIIIAALSAADEANRAEEEHYCFPLWRSQKFRDGLFSGVGIALLVWLIDEVVKQFTQ